MDTLETPGGAASSVTREAGLVPLIDGAPLVLSLRAEIERLREQLHYANGTCDLAMKHRDAAEADNERLRAENAELRSRLERIAPTTWAEQRKQEERQ